MTPTALNWWAAPAKINVFLHVVGKRADGYHNLQTAFQFLDYGDELAFELNDAGVITRNYDLGFSEADDLCLKAAHLLTASAAEHVDKGVTIHLNKRLPMGGGLGGGSSNAATVLIALNQLWQTQFSRVELASLARQLGADVPVFVMGQAAWAEGIGDQLTPIDVPETWVLVITPPVEVSTAQIFSHKQLTLSLQMMKIRALEKSIDFGFGENQLESIVRAEYPLVNSVFEWLSEYGQPRMSGSGAAVFMPLASQQHGLAMLANSPDGLTGFVAKTVNRHPLMDVS